MSNGQNPNYPPGPPGYPYQPQTPVQPAQPGYPVYPQPPAQPGYPAYPQPPVQPGYPQVQPGMNPTGPSQLPQYHLPDEAQVQQAFQQSRQEAARFGGGGDGTGPQYLKFKGPQGQTRWDGGVPVGYEGIETVYILPGWAPGKNFFRQVRSHFYKSAANPQGTSVGCPGPETCLICQAKDLAMTSPDPALVERAKSFGRVRKQYLYQVAVLNNVQGHYDQQGIMKPFLLGAGVLLHNAIGDLVDGRGGAMNIVDPQRGRPIRLKKRKTGPTMMDVEYSALDMDPKPLPQEFWGCLQNMWDLDKMQRTPDHAAMVQAIQEMGLPLPGGPGMGISQPQTGYQATPVPPYPSPYQQPMSPVGAPQAPTYMPPPADPYEFPPGSSGVDPAYQGMVNYPTQTAQPQPFQQPMMAPPAPPPVTSNPAATGPSYAPQAGQPIPAPPPPTVAQPGAASMAPMGGIPAAPPVTAPPGTPVRHPVAAPPAQAQTQNLTLPLAQGTQLPGGREKCFGRFDGGQYCQECPQWVKYQCQPLSGQVQPQGQAQSLEELQNQLAGKQ